MQQPLTVDQLFEQIKLLSPSEQFQLTQRVLATLLQQIHPTTETSSSPLKKERKPNLHPGAMIMLEGFDDELPDEFWFGDDNDEIYA